MTAPASTRSTELPGPELPGPEFPGPEFPGPGGPVASAPRSLSPSRAADFMTCPLLYRFRVLDRLPERPSAAAARGTLVHAVLEQLFDLPAVERTLERARALVAPQWQQLVEREPEVATLFSGGEQVSAWLESAGELLAQYFRLEDPALLEPAERELLVETTLDDGLVLRGFVDRLDVAPGGQVRVVDYKTGRAPAAEFEAKALFQMRFYALVLWRLHGTVPTLLQLLYLGNGEVLRYRPDEADLLATERKLRALWAAISRAVETGDWRPRPSKLCDWCEFRETYCPSFGGTPPPLPTLAEAPVGAGAAVDDDEMPGPRTPVDGI